MRRVGELVSAGGFACAGGFVCSGALPWGCDGELSPGRETTEACTFDVGAGPALAAPDCGRMYHQPPPASSRTPATIATVSMPLLEPYDPLSSALCSSSSGIVSSKVCSGSSARL